MEKNEETTAEHAARQAERAQVLRQSAADWAAAPLPADALFDRVERARAERAAPEATLLDDLDESLALLQARAGLPPDVYNARAFMSAAAAVADRPVTVATTDRLSPGGKLWFQVPHRSTLGVALPASDDDEPVKEAAPDFVVPAEAWPAGRPLRVAVVHGAWHPTLMHPYAQRVRTALQQLAAAEKRQVEVKVFNNRAGVGELSLSIERLLKLNRLRGSIGIMVTSVPALLQWDAVVALGVMIQGDTKHMEVVATAASTDLMKLGREYGVPVVNGIIPALTPQDAADRANGSKCQADYYARTALLARLPPYEEEDDPGAVSS